MKLDKEPRQIGIATILILLLCIILFSGCAFAPLSSRIGEQTGKMYQQAYDRGAPSAEQIVKAWPFISGLIRGTFGTDFEYKLSVDLQRTMGILDELCAKETLTAQDKGKIIGCTNRVEYLAGKEFYEAYGTTILKFIKTLVI
jgi:hypothetical protein